jgi:ABC-2 type transport system ATP-binding protein
MTFARQRKGGRMDDDRLAHAGARNSPQEVFRAESLTRKYGDLVAVDGIDLSVRSGEFFGFLGPNGAGKTTTIRMATGLLRPTSGSVRIYGMDPFKSPMEVKSLIGVAPDDPPLYDRLTGRENLEFVARIRMFAPDAARQRSSELLSWLGLEDAADKPASDYSLGMRKKLALACALLHRPMLLFLDEPFSGIDPIGVKSLKDALAAMVGDGATVFFSSHVMELAERLCTRIAIIHQGRIRGCGTLEELRQLAGLAEGATLEDAFVRLVGEGHEPGEAP